ncbi:MAG: hypothetical protein A2Y81_10630 [Nitrospirae bacterium RBG_13_43_8]|nr:MAG: hypothetical protein A2Y81_10630 [Nitrospirae bacterium RBG_13_43_8]
MDNVKAGVAFAENQNSFETGKRTAAEALQKLGQKGSLVLAFCTAKHDYHACFAGIKSEVGNVPVIGGPAIGVITNANIGYSGHQVGVAILPNDLTCNLAAIGGLDKGEETAGLELGRQLSLKRNPGEKLTLLFYDSVKSPPPPAPVLNMSTYLLDGFEKGIGKEVPLIVGAGLVGSFTFNRGKLFCGTKATEQHAVATIISGECYVDVTIMHGCKPMSDYHTITKVEGPVVYEIDSKPALTVIDNLLGNQDWQRRLPLLLITLGVNHGEKYAPYNEKNYVNRLIVGIIPEEKAIVLFEADFKEGTEFQFMRRSTELMEESAERRSREAMANLQRNKHEPFFAFYIDCAGRAAAFSGAEKEEASIIQTNIGQSIPLLGIYSGVEIAPLMGKSRGLDWTAVLLILSRNRKK